MAWPTWMPLSTRPSNWPDWSDIFTNTVPREWPKGLFGKGGQAWLDLEALGESLALARDVMEVVIRRIWPARDDDGTFLSDWETVFDVTPEPTIAKRQDRLIAKFRQRGTMTQDLVKAIMCRAWGSDDPSTVTLTSPTQGWAAVDETDAARLGHQMHISQTAGTDEPDPMIEDLISQNKPTWENWYYGKTATLKWGAHADDGEWDRRVWG